jgi:hypothetical protein
MKRLLAFAGGGLACLVLLCGALAVADGLTFVRNKTDAPAYRAAQGAVEKIRAKSLPLQEAILLLNKEGGFNCATLPKLPNLHQEYYETLCVAHVDAINSLIDLKDVTIYVHIYNEVNNKPIAPGLISSHEVTRSE